MKAKDQPVKAAIRSVIKGRRIGRKKVIAKVQRKYPQYSSCRIRRVYEQNGFSLYKRMKKRKANSPANPINIPLECLEEWAIDYMSDALVNGRRIRTLNIIDHYNRQCMGISIGHSLPATMAISQLERAIEKYGKPKGIRTDNGPEFTSKRFQKWLFDNGIEWRPIQKGKPAQNGIIERFNRTYREQVLDSHLFGSVGHAQAITSQWVEEYNSEWLHEALNFQSPLEYAA